MKIYGRLENSNFTRIVSNKPKSIGGEKSMRVEKRKGYTNYQNIEGRRIVPNKGFTAKRKGRYIMIFKRSKK